MVILSSFTVKSFYRKLGRQCTDFKHLQTFCNVSSRHLRYDAKFLPTETRRLSRCFTTSFRFYDKSEPKKDVIQAENNQKSQKLIVQKPRGSISVKAETDEDSNVTKVTIQKVQPPETKATAVLPAKKRLLIDFSASYTERNFITPMRAMTEYLLKQSDLESLPKVLRRSPYEAEPPITVYYRKDVEAKAIEVWGSKDALDKELLRRELDRRRYEQDVFTVKRRLRNYRREMSHKKDEEESGLKTRSGRVVLTAIGINGCNFLFKLCAWCYTGSHSLFSECIHSLADTVNQLILAYGIHKSVQMADPDHPYGYTNMRYVSSLISGVGIFCVGSGLSFYHGVMGILDPQPLHDFYWAYFVLGGAVVSEGATLMVALNSLRKGAKEADTPLYEYIMRSSDPSVNVVLLEDTAAVAGVIVAASCMAISQYTGNPLPDAVGSILVGTILGGVASFIILSNVGALVGRYISQYTGNPLPDAVGSILVGTILGGVASFIILSNVGALVGRYISQYTGNPLPDAVGSILVGTILGGVASFIILSNVGALVGRYISQYTGNPLPDAVGSILVGTILGGVASFIILSNVGALVGRYISQYTGNPLPEAVGSILVGTILGGVASFIILSNVGALVGRHISQYTGNPLPEAVGSILVGTILGGVASFIILSNVGALVGRYISQYTGNPLPEAVGSILVGTILGGVASFIILSNVGALVGRYTGNPLPEAVGSILVGTILGGVASFIILSNVGALVGRYISQYTGNPLPEAVGSILVGTILGGVASFIILSNVGALVGRYISQYTGNLLPEAVGSILVGKILGGVASFIILSNVGALVGRYISQYTGNPLPEAVGSILVGTILGGVASFIILSNVGALVGRYISQYTGNLLPEAVGSILVGKILGGVASFIILSNVGALVGRYISQYTGNPLPEAVGSILVGTILGGVASFIILSNVGALVGRYISQYTGNLLPEAVGSILVGTILGGVASFIILSNVGALVGRYISQYTGNPLPEAVGSILVGTILGGVASFIILSDVGALVGIGRSIPQEQLDEINSVLERDFMIRAIHDVKGIDIGSNLIRYKAEVDFDGRALTRSYLEKHDLNALLEDMKKIQTIDDVEAFLLKHGENIVDMLGGEIDRIELKLRKKFPQVRHCDLEIL